MAMDLGMGMATTMAIGLAAIRVLGVGLFQRPLVVCLYEAARQPIYVQPNPVLIQQQPVYTPQAYSNCTPWTEVQSSDGTISRTRTCTQ